MRLGCSGCLGGLLGTALLGLLLVGIVSATVRMLAPPAGVIVTSAADGNRAQQKLFEIARQTRPGHTVVLSEAELNALLARHLVGAQGLRLSGLQARLVGEDRLELRARSPLKQILDEIALGGVAAVLPNGWQARPVQLQVGARVRIDEEGPRQLRMEVDEFAVGRQRLPRLALRLLVDPAIVGLLRWRLPEHVEGVAIEPGRVIIRTAS